MPFQATAASTTNFPGGHQVGATGIAKRATEGEAKTAAEQNRRLAEQKALQTKKSVAFSSNTDAYCALYSAPL